MKSSKCSVHGHATAQQAMSEMTHTYLLFSSKFVSPNKSSMTVLRILLHHISVCRIFTVLSFCQEQILQTIRTSLCQHLATIIIINERKYCGLIVFARTRRKNNVLNGFWARQNFSPNYGYYICPTHVLPIYFILSESCGTGG